MVVRIVKMTIQPGQVQRFRSLFEGWEPLIRSFPGCGHLELLHDLADRRVFFTYSHWEDPSDLDAYRRSAVFSEVWPVVKTLFDAPAEAWTLERPVVAPGRPPEA